MDSTHELFRRGYTSSDPTYDRVFRLTRELKYLWGIPKEAVSVIDTFPNIYLFRACAINPKTGDHQHWEVNLVSSPLNKIIEDSKLIYILEASSGKSCSIRN